ncbi:MAG: sigma-70 family RNA polymerase sigma factor [Roseiflexaceae bacterium]|nr:sigma-70 family RNA polymerase sigma factor [Roseiflexaceae bacterium]
MQSHTDQQLLNQAAGGDTAALGLLYDRYGRLVFSVALRIVGERGSAEEITQDVFLRLWQHAERYNAERGSLMAWILTITQRRAIDELRSRRHTSQRREIELPETLPLGGSDHAQNTQLRTDLQQALSALPAAQREAIEGVFFGGLSRQDMAQRMGSPLPTINTRIRLGMEKLRALLGDDQW